MKNDPKSFRETQSAPAESYWQEGSKMTDPGFSREQQNRIDRYRAMEREVTDPLAARLLHDIVLDLEAEAAPGVAFAAPVPDPDGPPAAYTACVPRQRDCDGLPIVPRFDFLKRRSGGRPK
jgi:hypothetical protein